MTPGARAQAAIELLGEIIRAAEAGGAAADTLIARYFKTRRYAGSKDRRAVRDLVYAAIRRSGDRPESGRAALVGVTRDDPAVAALFDGGPHAPAGIDPGEPAASASVVPAWLIDALGDEGPALLDRAPLDLRVNRLKAVREAIDIPGAEPTPLAPDGLRLREPIDIAGRPEFLSGLIEVQDEGSQLVTLAAHAMPGMTIVDLCAGAGGKTLALAAAMAGQGRLIACDADRARLSRLGPRAERAGAQVEVRLIDAGHELAGLADLVGQADAVLIDAPCSGTGTWRRNPEARWRLTPARLEQLVAVQARLITIGAALVKPGGALVHIVCSLLPEEGPDQIADFLAQHGDWRADTIRPEFGTACGAGRRLSPARDGTDGFFVARLVRSC